MSYRNFSLSIVLSCLLCVVSGCICWNYEPLERPFNILAKELKMRENYWYVLECGEPILFYNDFQDYFVILKINDGNEKNIIYSRNSLNEEFETFRTSYIAPQTPKFEPTLIEKLPPECKGICTHFMYKGKKALFFDLVALRRKYGLKIIELIINDGKSGIGYTIHGNLAGCFLCKVSHFQILQAEPDFHLLDLPSVKKR